MTTKGVDGLFKTIISSIFVVVILIAMFFTFRDVNEVNGLVESENSTFVEAKENDKSVTVFHTAEEMTIEELVKNSTIVVMAEVKEILPTVETNDFVSKEEAAELRDIGYNIVHTDVVLKVVKFLGENKPDF
ncbi:hypothetical protein [Sporosarcina koreensis]|uniref:Uncharacterized protein n=1 Tax=Sporosarcina koreensis TaxID=334735 RepID=A0ABW0U2L0_9BACL